MSPNSETAIAQIAQPTFTNLDTYLRSHTALKGEGHTHTRIGDKNSGIFGGSYNISNDEWKDFMKGYCKTILRGDLEYLTEKQLEDNGAILLDFDFRYDSEIEQRQHTKQHVIDGIMLYADKILELVKVNDGAKIEVFAMEKNDPNRTENKPTKDGIHIIFGLAMHKGLQILLRDRVLPEIKNLWDDLPIINDWDSVVDEGVVKGISNWQMYGSRKPANQAYQVKYHFEICHNEGSWEYKELTMSSFSLEKNILKL
jgi:hypothetical protein